MLYLAGLAVIVLFALIGAVCVNSVFPEASGPLSVGVGFPLATGFFTLATFILSIAMVPLRWSYALAGLGIALSVLATWAFRRGNERRSPTGLGQQSGAGINGRESASALGLAGLALVLLGYLAVGRSYSTWDAIAIWSIKGYGISLEGTVLAARTWGSHGMTYPLNLPVLIALFRDLGLESLPASKLIFPAFYLSMALVSYDYARSRSMSVAHSLLGTLSVSTIPLIFEHATTGYANLPFTVFLVGGAVLLVDGISRRHSGALILSGLSVGLAAWTRPEGLLLAATGAAVAIIYFIHLLAEKKQIIAWLAPMVVVGGIWGIANVRFGVTSLLGNTLSVALKQITAGNFNTAGAILEFRYLGGQLLDIRVWGLILPMAIILLVANYRQLAGAWSGPHGVLLGAGVAYGVPVLVFYYLLGFRGNTLYWLDTGLNRMLMPASVLLFLWVLYLAPLSLGKPPTMFDDPS
ncbi:MAG: hypothetical protein WBR18_15550 [Anaerolineales bacterium]